MKNNLWSRHHVLKTMATSLGVPFLPYASFATNDADETLFLPSIKPVDKPITAIVLGAGNRGNVYGCFSLGYADQIDMVGVAELIPIRRERFSAKHNIAPDCLHYSLVCKPSIGVSNLKNCHKKKFI